MNCVRHPAPTLIPLHSTPPTYWGGGAVVVGEGEPRLYEEALTQYTAK